MVRINRGNVTNAYTDGLKLDPTTGNIPNDASDKVVLTYDFSNLKYCDVFAGNFIVNAASASLYTTPSDRDFYLVGANLTMSKDATATTQYVRIVGTPDGTGTVSTILGISCISLKAEQNNTSCNYNVPIKMKRNTTIIIDSSTAVGNFHGTGTIWGFTVQ